MLWRRAFIVGALVMSSVPAIAEETAEQWVQKMLVASRQASFQGHSVLLSGGKVTTLAIYHAPVNNEVWERVVHMSGQPAEILRKGSQIACLHPGITSRLEVGSTPMGKLSALEQGAQNVSHYYRFKRVGVERIADRSGVRIDVEPLDAYRFGYSLWLDDATGVLLKSQTLPSEGDPLEVFEFVTVDIGHPVPLEAFEPAGDLKASTEAISEPAQSADSPDEGRWTLEWLPDGFRQAGRAASMMTKPGRSVRVYTDGLAAFSVFFEPLVAGTQAATRSHGATVAVSRILEDSDSMVTVVGEIPLVTANKVSENIKVLAEAP